MLQKVLSAGRLSPTGATFARFVYSAPIAVIGILVYMLVRDRMPEPPGLLFLSFAAVGGLAQIIATICVVTLFKTRNFAVGITLSKTETILSVLVGLIVLGEGITQFALLSILIGLAGVGLLSLPPAREMGSVAALDMRSVALGLGSGFLFAISAVCYRAASLEIASTDAVIRAGLTLATVTTLQMTAMAIWLRWWDPAQIQAVWRARRVAVWIGLLSLGGSFFWFWAFALQSAAYVKAVGQVELILSLVASVLFFSERVTRRELAGIAVLGVSILGLILLG